MPLQPAAKERQVAELKQNRESTVTADLRSLVTERGSSAEQRRQDRNVAAQAAKAVGASPRAVEQAARVAKVAPDLLPQVQAGTLALARAHREVWQKTRKGW